MSVNLKEIDLTKWEPERASHHIESYKNSYTHELFDLNQSPWNITVFLLKNNLLTIFVRFDALILDTRSIASLMLELFDGQQHDIQTQIEKMKLKIAYLFITQIWLTGKENFLNYRLFLRFRGKHPYSIYRLHVTNVTVWL